MTQRLIGSQKSDSTKTPTLRQYYNANGSAPEMSYVKRIFKPNKTNSYALITDHDFRVNVPEDSEVYTVMNIELQSWALNDVALFVKVDDAAKGSFSVGIDDECRTVWRENEYGYHVEEGELALKRKATTPTRKKGRS